MTTALAVWQPPKMMSLEDLRALVHSVDLTHAPFPMWFTDSIFQTTDGERSVSAALSWRVPDRDDPKRLVIINHWVHLRPGISRDMAINTLANAVRTAFAHECAECFKLGGVRLFDPHPPMPPIKTEVVYYKEL